MTLPLIAVGGVLGAMLRWVVLDAASADADLRSFTLLAINVAGAGLVGWLAGRGFEPGSRFEDESKNVATVWPLMAVGFAGGFTSFATFTVDVAERINRGEISNSITMVVLTVLLAVGLSGFMFRRSWLKR